ATRWSRQRRDRPGQRWQTGGARWALARSADRHRRRRAVVRHRRRWRFGKRRDANLRRHLLEEVGILAEEVAHVLTSLPEAHLPVREPGAALVDDSRVDGDVEHASRVRDPFVVQDVELRRTKGRRDLVLDHLDLYTAPDDVEALLDGIDLADVHPHRGVELQRASTGGHLGIAEHDTDLLAELIDEDDARVGPADGRGQLAHRLR